MQLCQVTRTKGQDMKTYVATVIRDLQVCVLPGPLQLQLGPPGEL